MDMAAEKRTDALRLKREETANIRARRWVGELIRDSPPLTTKYKRKRRNMVYVYSELQNNEYQNKE